MNQSFENYAKSFSEIALKAENENEIDRYINNFLSLIKKNRDQKKINKIFSLIEKILRQKLGYRKILIESAREIKNKQAISSFITNKDKVEEKINPRLLAGIRVTINDEMQIDGSFSNKIKKVLNI